MSDSLQSKLELALVSYLWRFGGKIAADLLTADPALFDNVGALDPNPFISDTLFDEITWYIGHSAVDLKCLPRAVVTCASLDGDQTGDGYDLCKVEILLTAQSDGPSLAALLKINSEVLEILQRDNLPLIQHRLNRPCGDDPRAVTGIGIDGLEFKGQQEGRDDKENRHGVRLNFDITAHLESDAI